MVSRFALASQDDGLKRTEQPFHSFLYPCMRRNDALHRELDRLQARLPNWAKRLLHRTRRPSSLWLRLPLSLALIVSGIVGTFLPILGFWMVPLGLALLAIDLPLLRPPLTRILGFINRKLAAQAG